MPSRTSVPGERKLWLTYLLWFTVVGHRWYLGKLSLVYTLTFGYFGLMWFLDLFRIPKMVREYNSYVYQRHVAQTANESTISPTTGTETPAEKALRWAEPTISVMEQLARTWDEVRAKWASSKKFKVLAVAAAVLVIIAVLSAVASKNGKEETRTSALVTTETEKEGLNVSLKTPSGLTVNVPNATLEGITEPGAEITVLGCANAPISLQAGEDGTFTAPLTLNEGTNHITVSAEKEGRRGSASCALTYQLDEAAYKAQCRTIEFKVLNKNPEAYKGQKFFATGQVVQVVESFGSTDIRLNVTRNQWGYWEDTIYVTYAGTIPAYEDSIIRVWGEIKGSYSYTSVAGWNITLPWVEAKYIEVVQR